MSSRVHLLFSAAFTLLVLATAAWALTLVGLPSRARAERLDQRRLQDLKIIFREVQSLCRDPDLKDELKQPLPETLEALAARARSERINLNDPETGEPYSYVVKDATSYELCATFSLQRNTHTDVFWNHPPGRHCFLVDALDPP